MALENFLFQKFEDNAIPAGRLTKEYPELEIQFIKAAGKNSGYNGRVTMYLAEQVSSMEWPVVIFVTYYDYVTLALDSYARDYQLHYRARSRATAYLIEISAVKVAPFRGLKRSLSDTQIYSGIPFYNTDNERGTSNGAEGFFQRIAVRYRTISVGDIYGVWPMRLQKGNHL